MHNDGGDETSFIPNEVGVEQKFGLAGLAFNDEVRQPRVKPPLNEGEVYTPEGRPSEFSPAKQRKMRPTTPKKKPALLSPAEQREILRQRKANLLTSKKLFSNKVVVYLSPEDYSALLDMAEREQMAGSMAHNFVFFLAWCIKVGLKYYNDVGLSHINPDKISFIDETPEDLKVKPLGPPELMRSALERSVVPRPPMHPILGRTVQHYPTELPEEYGNLMTPNPTIEDLNLEDRYIREYREEKQEAPDILSGRAAFDTEALRSTVLGAMLPPTTK